jgi:hypothetical protein
MKHAFRLTKPSFHPLNYEDELRLTIFDLRLPISNAECEKDSELFYCDDSRSDATIADSFRPALLSTLGRKRNYELVCF